MIQAGLVAAYWEVEDREAWRGPASLDPLLRDLFDRQEEGLYEHLRDWGVVPVRRHHLLPAARGVLGVLLGTFYPETWRLLLQGLASRREVPLQTPRGEVRLRRVALDPRHHPHLGQLDEEAFYRPRPLMEPVTLRTWSPPSGPPGDPGGPGGPAGGTGGAVRPPGSAPPEAPGGLDPPAGSVASGSPGGPERSVRADGVPPLCLGPVGGGPHAGAGRGSGGGVGGPGYPPSPKEEE